MRLKHYINEEWVKTYGGRKYEVIKNPSKKEMLEISTDNFNELRFIADNDSETLWIFSPISLIHHDVWTEVTKISKGVRWMQVDLTKYLFGMCKKMGGNWILTESDKIQHGKRDPAEYLEELYDNAQWLKTYMNIDKFFKRMFNQWL
jgi:hypothetical protein